MDKAYFEKIHQCVDDCTWCVSYHGCSNEISEKEAFLLNIGISTENINFFSNEIKKDVDISY